MPCQWSEDILYNAPRNPQPASIEAVHMNIAMFAFAFISLLLSRIAIAQYPYPIAFTGPAAANVPNSLSYQDISIIRRLSDNKYFRFSKSNDTGLGLSVATSPTFGGPWTYSYAALSGHLKDPAAANRSSIHLWAPEVHYANDIYYLYYCINAPDHGNGIFDIAVATSPNLREGSWTDHGSVGIPVAPDSAKPDREYVRLGANILANGTYPSGFDTDFKHITFGSFNQGLYGVPLAKDLLTAVPDVAAVEILSDQYNPESDRDEKIAGNKTEGSYALHHGQYIYQFYSIGSCCASSHDAGSQSVYRVEVCRGLYSDGPTGKQFLFSHRPRNFPCKAVRAD